MATSGVCGDCGLMEADDWCDYHGFWVCDYCGGDHRDCEFDWDAEFDDTDEELENTDASRQM